MHFIDLLDIHASTKHVRALPLGLRVTVWSLIFHEKSAQFAIQGCPTSQMAVWVYINKAIFILMKCSLEEKEY